MNKTVHLVVTAAAMAALLGLDLALGASKDTSLLLSLLFWSALAQGAVALAAVGELTGARWLGEIQDRLSGLAYLLFLFPVVFLVFGMDLSAYGWHQHPTAWLQPAFFLARNAGMLLLTSVLAVLFARAARAGSQRRGTFAVLYLFAFVVTQSLAGYDWVMSFEYPWISTMFGPLFFIEAFFGGIALSVILSSVTCLRSVQHPRDTLRDSVTLLFGFSLLWVGLFFAQYLTIWYGNIPEEVAFLSRRLEQPFLNLLFWFVLLAYFVVPFFVLISQRAKVMPYVTLLLSLLTFAALFAQRLFYLLPVSSVSPWLACLEWCLLGLPFLVFLGSGSTPARNQA